MAESPLLQLPVSAFLDRLAANTPTPGGGSVAALTGSLAACLGRMVAAYTVGKPKFAAVEAEVTTLAERFARADEMFRRLIDEDAAAYEVLNAALRRKKDDLERPKQVADAAVLAASVPLETALLALKVADDLARLKVIGNPLLASDALAAHGLARAAVDAAVANVRANLPLMAAEARGAVEGQLAAFSQ